MYKDIKNNLIETAFELFKEQGYEKTTIMDICNACNITKTTFYRYIASKDDLLTFFFNDISEESKDYLLSITTTDNYWEMICHCFDIIIERAIKFGPELYAQLYITNLKTNKGTFNPLPTFENLVIEFIEKAQQNNQIQSIKNPKELYTTSVNLCFGCGIRWCIDKGKFDYKQEFFSSLETLFNVNKY